MKFVDTHVHLHFPDYDEDQPNVIKQAREAGVECFINIGTDVTTSEQSLALAEEHEFIYAAAGIHPHDAKDADEKALADIEKLLKHPRMVAIGEVGLDFYRDHSPKERQVEVLNHFLKLQAKIQKPLVIHCRDAYEELLQIFKKQSGPLHGVIHCFSSNKAVMGQFVELGFYISFAGPLTYKKNDELREACKACPIDRLLLETDAPFLPPQSRRGKRNESAYMLETAEVAAKLHNLSLEELGQQTTENARKVFRL